MIYLYLLLVLAITLFAGIIIGTVKERDKNSKQLKRKFESGKDGNSKTGQKME